MLMSEVLEKLKDLQDILAQKNIVQQAISDAPKLLVAQEELLARMKKNYIEKNDQYEKIRQNIVELKAQLFEAESTRENSEKAMDTITTQREYEALDKEIKEASEREGQIRKDIQREERQHQDLDEILKNEETLIKNQEKELNERKESINSEIEEKNKKLASLIEAEEELSPGINPETKFKLERIIKSKQGVGIVAIHGNVCNGCHMILPAQFANEVRIGDKIVYCPYCSRILYFVESAEADTDYFNDDDAGSLSDLEDFLDDEESDDEESDDEDEDEIKMDYED